MGSKSIKLDTNIWQIAVIILAILCLVLTYFFARSFFANTIASRALYKEISEITVMLAPNDPQTHLTHAGLLEKTFFPEDLPKAIAEYERAVALSPADFNLWLELGRARERSGDARGAEPALRKSLQLAPNYSRVQWTLGNFLLRQDKQEEAFAEIRKAAQGDPQYANPAIGNAWQIFGGETARIEQFVGDSPNLKSSFAALLAREKQFDKAVEIWNSLPENSRQILYKANGEEIYQKMLEAKKYRTALQMFAQLGGAEKKIAVGQITNGGFEDQQPKSPSVFEWQIADAAEPQIGVDNAEKYGGELALVLVFNNPDGKAFRNLSQTVAVEAGRKYLFEGFYKSELKTTATLKWEIADAVDGKLLASTDPVAAKTDWTNLKIGFTAPAETQAVVIRLARVSCGSTLCPISGKVWFDDFSLK